ncbi:MAG: hypothetical protein ACLGG0_05610 [Bacteriovoracia bacterium]
MNIRPFKYIILVFCASCLGRATYQPDFRGFVPSKTTYAEFKSNPDFSKCLDISGEYKEEKLAYVYTCKNISPHIKTMQLKFSMLESSLPLITLEVIFKDEKNIRNGSQAISDTLLGKFTHDETKPSRSMTREQVVQFLSNDQFRFECATTQCNGIWHYHGDVMSSIFTEWYASGNSVLELFMVDLKRFDAFEKARQEAIGKKSKEESRGLGI